MSLKWTRGFADNQNVPFVEVCRLVGKYSTTTSQMDGIARVMRGGLLLMQTIVCQARMTTTTRKLQNAA